MVYWNNGTHFKPLLEGIHSAVLCYTYQKLQQSNKKKKKKRERQEREVSYLYIADQSPP